MVVGSIVRNFKEITHFFFLFSFKLSCEIIVKLGGCYKAGLVVNSNTEDTYNTSTFSNVSLVNIDQRNYYNNETRPFGLALADPCQFEIENRDDVPDCDSKSTHSKAEIVKEFPTFPNPAREMVNVDLNEFIGDRTGLRAVFWAHETEQDHAYPR